MPKVNNLVVSVLALAYIFVSSFALVYFPLMLVVLLVPLFVVVLWLYPNVSYVPKSLLFGLFYFWLASLVLWPNYISIYLPGLPAINPPRLALIGLLSVWFFFLFKSDELRSALRDSFENNRVIILSLLLLIILRFITIFISDYSFLVVYHFAQDIVEVVLPLIVFVSLFKTQRDINKFILVFMALGCIVLIISLFEFLKQQNLFSLYLPPGFMLSSDFIEQVLSDKSRGQGYRVQGTFSHPLLLVQYLILLFPAILYSIFVLKNNFIKFSLILSLPLLLFVLYGTDSRSAWFGFIVVIVSIALLYLYRIIALNRATFLGWFVVSMYPVFILLGLLVSYLIIDLVVGHTAAEIRSTNMRLMMWDNGLESIKQSPILGYGLGMGGYALALSGAGGALSIDSYYLSILLESGYLGMMLFIFMLVKVVHVGVKLISSIQVKVYILSVMIVSAILGYLSIALILSTDDNMTYLYLFLGIIMVLNMNNKAKV